MLRVLTLVAVATAILLLLALRTHDPNELGDDPPLVFRSFSDYPQTEVRKCILEGNGNSAFSDFQAVDVGGYISPPDEFNEVLVDSRGSRLFIGLRGLETAVTYRSLSDPTEQQLDLLEWCIDDPTNLWLPKGIRP